MNSFRLEALKSNKNNTVPSGLMPIHELLTSRGWTNDASGYQHSSHNTSSRDCKCDLTYIKNVSSDDEFRIRISEDKITVAVPIANAPYLYASSFKSYYAATEFVGKHLDEYESKTEHNGDTIHSTS